MSDQTIFDNTNTQPVTQATQTNQSSPVDNVADLLKLIVNDKGEPKYKTIQDALVGLQQHVQALLPSQQQFATIASLVQLVAFQLREFEYEH